MSDNVVKMDELKGQEIVALRSLLAEKQGQERKALFKQALGQLPKTHVLRQVRRSIARISTELSRRQAQIQVPQAEGHVQR